MAWEDLESDISDLFEDCQADTSPLGMALSSASARSYNFKKNPRLFHRNWGRIRKRYDGESAQQYKKRYERMWTAELKRRRAERAPIVIKPIGRPAWLQARFARRRSA